MADRSFTIAAEPVGPLRAVRDAGHRRLPVRYQTDVWDLRFRSRLSSLLKPGAAVLDVGAGRRPTVPIGHRPSDTRYVGLDVDAAELEEAEPGSYDETVVAAAEDRVAGLEGEFDLALSFFALEHVRSTAKVIENVNEYLRPGGWFLGQLSGARSPFSLANRLLPHRVSRALLGRALGRHPEAIFPARYDSCTYSKLTALLDRRWPHHEVLPLFTGAGYVLFSRALTAAYVGYEELIYRTRRSNLAPYYLIAARK